MEQLYKYWPFLASLIGFGAFSWLLSALFKDNPFVGVKDPFTEGEVKFLRILEKACQRSDLKLRVMGKMRVADIIKMNPKLKGQAFWKQFRKISQTHVDYSLLDHNYKLKAVVELDDKSHENRVGADKLKNDVFEAAGLPLIRVKAKFQYDPSEIVSQIQNAIKNK